MKIIIDDKVCLKHKMTLNEVLIALSVRTERLEDNLENMVKREILVKNGHYQVTQHWSDVLDEIKCDSEGNLDDNRLTKLAEEIQNIFPSGYKRDERTGTRYYHKSNRVAIKQALKRFIANFGDYPDEEILDAAKQYVASFRGNYTFPFQMANYAVCKDLRSKGGDITSPIATILENKGSEKDVNVSNDDWLINSRN